VRIGRQNKPEAPRGQNEIFLSTRNAAGPNPGEFQSSDFHIALAYRVANAFPIRKVKL
jgi:hypothetical protein